LMRLTPPKRRGFNLHRALTAHVAARLDQAAPLRRLLQDAPLDLGHPMWTELEQLDLSHHIVAPRLRRPGGEMQLTDLVARLHAEPLPRGRPLWQFVVIDGLADNSLALYAKVHHALLDGQGGVALARVLLDIEPGPTHSQSRKRRSEQSDEAPSMG